MRKILKITVLLTLSCLALFSCSKTDNILSNEISNGFTNEYNASFNAYYKDNNVETVTASFKNTNGRKNIYYYNESGYLYQLDVVGLDVNGAISVNTSIWDLDPENDSSVYENDLLVKQYYDSNSLLTESIYDYNNGLLIKKSDYRNDELFYQTEYNYNDNNLVETRIYHCFTSAGLGFGVSCTELTEFKYNYTNGNLISIKNSNTNENTLVLNYSNNSNLPVTAVDHNTELELSYTYFK